jgi:tetratricopeptide (TPR) repeat protein
LAIRLLFLLFVVVLAAFGYVSLLNGQHVTFFLSSTRQFDLTVSELVLLAFSLGASMVVLGTMAKDVAEASRGWKERRDRQRREAARERVAKASGLFRRGMLDEAAKELSRSLSVNADDREALELMATVEIERRNPLEAAKALTRLRQNDPTDLSVQFRLADLYRSMNDLDTALSLLKAAESFEGENPRAWTEIRDLHIRKGEMLPAYEAHKKVVRFRGKEAGAADRSLMTALRYEKATYRMAEGRSDDAERRLRELVKEQPEFVPAWLSLAELLQGRRKTAEAMELLAQGYRATRNPVTLIRVEDLGVETEQPQSVMRIYSDLIREFPHDVDLHLFLGKFYLRLEMNDEGLEQLLKAESLEPERESILILLAEAYRRRGRYDSASQYFQRAIGYKRRFLIPFRCGGCGKATIKWSPRCPACGDWNSYAVDHGGKDYAAPATAR